MSRTDSTSPRTRVVLGPQLDEELEPLVRHRTACVERGEPMTSNSSRSQPTPTPTKSGRRRARRSSRASWRQHRVPIGVRRARTARNGSGVVAPARSRASRGARDSRRRGHREAPRGVVRVARLDMAGITMCRDHERVVAERLRAPRRLDALSASRGDPSSAPGNARLTLIRLSRRLARASVAVELDGICRVPDPARRQCHSSTGKVPGRRTSGHACPCPPRSCRCCPSSPRRGCGSCGTGRPGPSRPNLPRTSRSRAAASRLAVLAVGVVEHACGASCERVLTSHTEPLPRVAGAMDELPDERAVLLEGPGRGCACDRTRRGGRRARGAHSAPGCPKPFTPGSPGAVRWRPSGAGRRLSARRRDDAVILVAVGDEQLVRRRIHAHVGGTPEVRRVVVAAVTSALPICRRNLPARVNLRTWWSSGRCRRSTRCPGRHVDPGSFSGQS